MLADTNPGLFTLLMLITAALFGPFVYVCLCIIIIYFLCPTPSSANELQTIKLQPTTQVGHLDGFCYLELFSPPHRQSLRASLSCYPTIIELVAIAASYRKRIRGSVKIIGDCFALFERNKDEGYVWDVLKEVMSRFEFIGSGRMRILLSTPSLGYKYVELLYPKWRNEVLHSLGPFPCLHTIINVNHDYQMAFIGVLSLSKTVKDQWCLEKELKYYVWDLIVRIQFGAEDRID